MRDPKDIITEVVNGKGPQLAAVLEVSTSRCYEILSTDNPVPKTKRLIRAIAQVNREGCRLIRADFDAFFDDILGDDSDPVSDAELLKENMDPIQSVLNGDPVAIQRKELLEAIATNARKLREFDAQDVRRDQRNKATAVTFERAKDWGKNGRGLK